MAVDTVRAERTGRVTALHIVNKLKQSGAINSVLQGGRRRGEEGRGETEGEEKREEEGKEEETRGRED